MHAQREVGTLEKEVQCQICFEEQADTITHPCKHLEFCRECIQKQREHVCSVCRKPISRMEWI